MNVDNETVVTVIKFSVKTNAEDFERAFTAHADFMRNRDGFLQAHLVRSSHDPNVYVNVGWWRDAAAYLETIQAPEFAAHIGEFAKLADVEPLQGSVALSLVPSRT